MEQAPGKIEDPFKKELVWAVGRIFDTYNSDVGRRNGLNVLALRLSPYLAQVPNGDFIMKDFINACDTIEDRDAFIEKTVSLLEPLLKFKEENPLVFEGIRREDFMKSVDSTKLNDILSYTIDEPVASLHLPPAREFIKTQGLLVFREEVKKALVLLANIVFDNENIREINGISWIIAKNPKLLEALGFTVEHGRLPDEDGPNGKMPVSVAYMSREDFLERYHKV